MEDVIEDMRIGELAARSGASRRLIRYYEEQGLISPGRTGNGYRTYDERYVDRVVQIRNLIAAGLPTRVIKQILPCLDSAPSIAVPEPAPEILATLERERDSMSERIECLTGNRDAIARYLDAVRAGRSPDGIRRTTPACEA